MGIKPLGNHFLAQDNAKNYAGLFQMLPEEVLAPLLEHLDSSLLLLIGSTCKYLYSLSKSDDLWKSLFIESQGSRAQLSWKWLNSWRSTYLGLNKDVESNIFCDNVYSDFLYRPYLCAHTPLEPYTSDIPKENAITRHEYMSLTDFSNTWSKRPFILTHAVQEWPISKTWSIDSLLENYRHIKFRAEAVNWYLADYVTYMRNNRDESPLYLFDKKFVEKMKLQTGNGYKSSYWTPECFGEDFFTALGDKRPDYRWLIIGPERSGSTFHMDPNATSAWNAVLRGSKYWIMFPPSTKYPTPPGVYVSNNLSEVTSPVSIAEWLLNFHAQARKTPGCIECICKEGEIVHVPSGWWHLVVNLEPTIAITQNFVPGSQLAEALHFMRDKTSQVSGFTKDVEHPYHLFIDQLQAKHPDRLRQTLEELATRDEGKKRKWKTATGTDDGERVASFSFDFGDDSDLEIP
ncbi:BgtA-20919 [Blumeria graminis f. sp. tritici]|uniref:BgtA-20919 n=2 Tax=Blumeria graminis f. sp. tritici TaxID=62690 RepID=A0A9X9QED1_BLUGR|nr:hypothetical protein BGT96224_A20919 [Blumeria graminis f. sp. tritici 96224]VDB90700.1 BgtA-20919 [Blumeria graminis f. sp. tritici]